MARRAARSSPPRRSSLIGVRRRPRRLARRAHVGWRHPARERCSWPASTSFRPGCSCSVSARSPMACAARTATAASVRGGGVVVPDRDGRRHLKLNHYVVDTSIIHHIAAAPAVDPRWTSGVDHDRGRCRVRRRWRIRASAARPGAGLGERTARGEGVGGEALAHADVAVAVGVQPVRQVGQVVFAEQRAAVEVVQVRVAGVAARGRRRQRRCRGSG